MTNCMNKQNKKTQYLYATFVRTTLSRHELVMYSHVRFLTVFLLNQMNRVKLALAMSWRSVKTQSMGTCKSVMESTMF